MDISVIIVNWNTRELLEECLGSLISAPPSRSTEIIVVDNASSDGSVEMVESRYPHVKLIRSQENLGFAKANNLGIQCSAGRYVSLVNSDVRVLPGCLDTLAEYLDQNVKVGNVGPCVLNADMSWQSSCRRFPTLWNNFCSATGLVSAFKRSRFFSGEHMLYSTHDRTVAVDVLVGCFWMLRREAIEDVGGLDESFFMYGEDVDWCRRCWSRNWQVVFVPGAQAIHYRGGSSGTQIVRLAVAQQEAVLHYWSKHKSALDLVGIKCILFFHHAVRYLLRRALGFFQTPENLKANDRVGVSWACLHALVRGPGEPHLGLGIKRSAP